MSKRLAIAVVAFACVSLALGAAVKIRWFDNIAEPNPDADGMAILNYKLGQNNTVAQIILSDLLPNTEYVVALRVPGTWTTPDGEGYIVLADGFDPFSALNRETDNKGHLTIHGTASFGDWSDSDVLVFLQSDWDAVFPPPPAPPATFPAAVTVRLIGYNGTPPPPPE